MRNFILSALVICSLGATTNTFSQGTDLKPKEKKYQAVKTAIDSLIGFQDVVGDTSNADVAKAYFNEMEALVGNDSNKQIELNLRLGWFKVRYNLLQSFENIRNAIKAARESKNNLLIGESYLTAGMLMEKEVDYITGLQYYFAATNSFKILKNERKLAFCYSKIGNLLAVYVQYDRAIEYLSDAKEIFHQLNDIDQYARVIDRLIAIQLRAGDQENAIKALAEMEFVLRGKSQEEWLIKTYSSMAEMYIATGETALAEEFLSKSYGLLNRVTKKSEFKILPYLGFAKFYTQQGESNKAIQYLKFSDKVLSKVDGSGDDFLAINQDLNLAYYAYYLSVENGQQATSYLAKYNELNIQIQNNLSEKIAAMVKVFEAEKEENYTIANLQSLNEKQRQINEQQNMKLNYMMILAVVLIFVLAAIYYRYRERQKIAKYLETEVESRTQELKAKSEEKTLMLKEIHHRVKNNLQLISSFLNLQKHYSNNDKSTEMIITETQERVRCMAIIHEKLYSAESLSNLDTKAYLNEIANFVYQSYSNETSRIQMEVNIASAGLTLDRMIPCGLIINELLSNCFKYAFKGLEEGIVWVDFTHENDRYKLIIKDNGIGLPPNFSLEELDSLGMNIVVGLVEQLDGVFNVRSESGTVFEFSFP